MPLLKDSVMNIVRDAMKIGHTTEHKTVIHMDYSTVRVVVQEIPNSYVAIRIN